MNNTSPKITIFGHTRDLWQTCLYLLLAIYGFTILFTLSDYGVTIDEPPLLKYGKDIVTWYQSGFEDQEVFDSNNTFLYGGYIHTISYLLTQILPLPTYDTYHLLNVTAGFLGVIAVYRLGVLLGGGPAGVLAALFLILTPRYYGHAFNNPKDIPFAVGYIWSIYWIVRDLTRLPDLSRNWIWKTGLAIGLTLGCRAAGLILFAYLGLFFGIRYLQLATDRPIHTYLRPFVFQLCAIAGVAYLVMLPFWPWALLNPLTGLIEAMTYFSKFVEPHFSFFDCRFVSNLEIPWHYVSKWLLLTLPEFILFGLLAGIATLFTKFRSSELPQIQYGLVLFSAAFPIVYAALMRTPLYDGYRHFLFVVPPLVAFSAIGIVDQINRIKVQWVQRGVLVLTAGLAIWTLGYMIYLHPNQYVYFNHLIAGGIQNAAHCYETDYWGNSYKQGVVWLEKNYPWDFSKRKIRIASYYGQLHNVMNLNYFERIEEPDHADLYVATTRYDRHLLIPGEVVHIVRADNTPLLYIIRPDSTFQHDPFFSQSPFRQIYLDLQFPGPNSDQQEQTFFQQVKKYHLGSFVAGVYNNQGLRHHQAGDNQKAEEIYKKGLSFQPHHMLTLYNLGQVLQAQGKIEEAATTYEKSLQLHARRILDPDARRAIYLNLGACYQKLGHPDLAIEAYQGALEWAPQSPTILNNIAGIHLRNKKFEAARKILQPLIDRLPNNTNYRLNLVIALVGLEDYPAALAQCLEAQKRDPENPIVRELLDTLQK
ncbi:MAG: tetratricopeptide repeat protein [bacterium]|nr:tetratricopeptide repeat protein [bacterium]